MNNEHTKITGETLEELLYLSRLSPDSCDLKTLSGQVEKVLEYFDVLAEHSGGENPYDAYPSTQAELLRDDSTVAGIAIQDVKKMTGEFLDGYFRVPKVLGGGA